MTAPRSPLVGVLSITLVAGGCASIQQSSRVLSRVLETQIRVEEPARQTLRAEPRLDGSVLHVTGTHDQFCKRTPIHRVEKQVQITRWSTGNTIVYEWLIAAAGLAGGAVAVAVGANRDPDELISNNSTFTTQKVLYVTGGIALGAGLAAAITGTVDAARTRDEITDPVEELETGASDWIPCGSKPAAGLLVEAENLPNINGTLDDRGTLRLELDGALPDTFFATPKRPEFLKILVDGADAGTISVHALTTAFELRQWERAQTANSIDGWRNFRRAVPWANRFEAAGANLRDLLAAREAEDWKQAHRTRTVAALERYLTDHDAGPNASSARLMLITILVERGALDDARARVRSYREQSALSGADVETALVRINKAEARRRDAAERQRNALFARPDRCKPGATASNRSTARAIYAALAKLRPTLTAGQAKRLVTRTVSRCGFTPTEVGQ